LNQCDDRKKGEKTRKKDKVVLQRSHTIGYETGGIAAETTRDSSLAIPPRPAVIAQGNWKFVEQLLQVNYTKL